MSPWWKTKNHHDQLPREELEAWKIELCPLKVFLYDGRVYTEKRKYNEKLTYLGEKGWYSWRFAPYAEKIACSKHGGFSWMRETKRKREKERWLMAMMINLEYRERQVCVCLSCMENRWFYRQIEGWLLDQMLPIFVRT